MPKIPNLPKKKECKHKNSFPLYARIAPYDDKKEWRSTKKILGYMVHICLSCGAFIQVKTKKEEIKDEKTRNKKTN